MTESDQDELRPSPELEQLAQGPVVTTTESWRGSALPLTLTASDLELLDHVLCVYPELRIVAFLGQLARARQLAYPIREAATLAQALGEDRLELVEHRIDHQEIVSQLPHEWFPINHEGELLSAIHRALVTCSSRAAQRRVRTLGGLPDSD